MSISRRDFVIKAGGAALVATTLRTKPILAQLGVRPEPVPPAEDPRLKALALRGVDAAHGAGASYADARLSHTMHRSITPGSVWDSESVTVGIRALVDGYWGFASGPVLDPAELARLGREAVHQARVNALGGKRVAMLAPAPVVSNGNWIMPVQRDAFQVSPFEVQDLLNSLAAHARRTPGFGANRLRADLSSQDVVFASSEGSYCTQRLFRTSGVAGFLYKYNGRAGGGALDCLSPAGLGYELFTADRLPLIRNHSIYGEIDRLLAEIEEDAALPRKPVEVNRYDTVFDVSSMAAFADDTLGRATELDRALGYEANAGGTSYLSNPLGMVGNYQAGSPLLNLTGDRNAPGSAAWVQWDEEGVAPVPFSLVKEGVLVDFQTTREMATKLSDYYAKTGQPVRSHGCADAPRAVDVQMLHTANLVMAPAERSSAGFDELVAGLSDGVAVRRAGVDMDFEAISGMGNGLTYEVKHGKRVAIISGAAFLFSAPEFWKGLKALGGSASARRFGRPSTKGEPPQSCAHSVTAVPAVVKQLALINPYQKA
ncbi:MAG: TldD/PmbA family protein [Gemmatimonadaceae bacterium]